MASRMIFLLFALVFAAITAPCAQGVPVTITVTGLPLRCPQLNTTTITSNLTGPPIPNVNVTVALNVSGQPMLLNAITTSNGSFSITTSVNITAANLNLIPVNIHGQALAILAGHNICGSLSGVFGHPISVSLGIDDLLLAQINLGVSVFIPTQ